MDWRCGSGARFLLWIRWTGSRRCISSLWHTSEAGDTASARREVLRALELAPNFEKAQQLLLRLRGTGGTGGAG